MISRSEAQRAFEARDQAKRERDAERTRAQQLEAELAALKGGQGGQQQQGKPSGDEPPSWAQELMKETRELRARVEGKDKAEQRRGIVDSVLKNVPDGNRQAAKLMLEGLVALGEVSLDGDNPQAIADAAAAKLKSSHGTLFVPAGSSASAIQVGPDGKMDWGSVKHLSEVPPGMLRDMPDEVFQRLSAGAGNTQGLLIRGGR